MDEILLGVEIGTKFNAITITNGNISRHIQIVDNVSPLLDICFSSQSKYLLFCEKKKSDINTQQTLAINSPFLDIHADDLRINSAYNKTVKKH